MFMLEKMLHFSQPELQVYYFNESNLKTRRKLLDHYNYMLITLNGNCQINYNNKFHITKNNDVFIAGSNETFTVEFSENPTEVVEIWFISSLFHKIDKNYDLLKPFYDTKNIKVYNSETNTDNFNLGLRNLLLALRNRSSRAFVFSSLLQLICELNLIYERINSVNGVKETDSNYAKIISYIDRHLYEKLTLKDISDNVFLSEKCICNTVKKICGMTYHEFITSQRFVKAQELVRGTNIPFIKIADICGFNTYSTFYRTYKRRFGITPSEDRENNLFSKQK